MKHLLATTLLFSASVFATPVTLTHYPALFSACYELRHDTRCTDLPQTFDSGELATLTRLYVPLSQPSAGAQYQRQALAELTSEHFPGVKEVELISIRPDVLAEWVKTPLASQLTTLKVRGDIGLAGAEALGETTTLGALRALTVEGGNLGASGVFALTQSPYLNLEKLGIEDDQVTAAMTSALVRRNKLHALVELSLAGSRLGAYALSSLAHMESVPNLRVLNLANAQVEKSDDLKALLVADNKILAQVETLDLSAVHALASDYQVQNALAGGSHLPALKNLGLRSFSASESEQILGAIARQQGLTTLAGLDLTGAKLTYETVRTLTNEKVFQGLKRLRLYSAGLGLEEAQLLGEAKFLDTLEELTLGDNRLSPQFVEALLKNAARLTHLKTLSLGLNKLGNESLRILASAVPHLTSLQDLELGSGEFDQQGLVYLAAAPFPSLRRLGLRNNEVHELAKLIPAGGALEKLTELEIAYTPLAEDAQELAALRARLPQTKLVLH